MTADDLERIAEDVHNSWMLERELQGWKYGERYSLEEKLHPSMIPYCELPEKEKQLDRSTAKQVIRSLIRLGYRIKK